MVEACIFSTRPVTITLTLSIALNLALLVLNLVSGMTLISINWLSMPALWLLRLANTVFSLFLGGLDSRNKTYAACHSEHFGIVFKVDVSSFLCKELLYYLSISLFFWWSFHISRLLDNLFLLMWKIKRNIIFNFCHKLPIDLHKSVKTGPSVPR